MWSRRRHGESGRGRETFPFNREHVVQGCRDTLDELRHAIRQGHAINPAALQPDTILARLQSRLGAANTGGLKRVVNATGTVLHDRLGLASACQCRTRRLRRAAARFPQTGSPRRVIVVEHDFMGAHRIAGRFRQARPPIIGRVKDDRFLLDARTIFDPLDLVPNWTDELA